MYNVLTFSSEFTHQFLYFHNSQRAEMWTYFCVGSVFILKALNHAHLCHKGAGIYNAVLTKGKYTDNKLLCLQNGFCVAKMNISILQYYFEAIKSYILFK